MTEDLRARIDEHMQDTVFLDDKNRLLKDDILDRFAEFVENECSTQARYHELQVADLKNQVDSWKEQTKTLRAQMMEHPAPRAKVKRGKK